MAHIPKSGLAGASLSSLTAVADKAAGGDSRRGLPPVHLWNPPFCGEMDMRIATDGTWFHEGSPIGRAPLVRLFASILRRDPARDGDRIMLVTPVEKVAIKVDDAPFLGVELVTEGNGSQRVLSLRTNVDEWITISPEHPLRFAPGASHGLKPYVMVRPHLEALVKRAVFYDLVDMGEVREIDGIGQFGVASGAAFFPMAPAAEVQAWT